MRKILAVAFACIFFTSTLAVAESLQQIQKELTRSGEINGIKLSFIILDDQMIEFLYGKENLAVIKSKLTPSGTAFYFTGTANKEALIDKLIAVQEEQPFVGAIINSKISLGQSITKGEKIAGIFQLEKKVDFYKPFEIKGSTGSIYFKLTDAALRNLN